MGTGHLSVERDLGNKSTSEVAEVEWPRISIVTAVRNGARYLEATIRSVLSQAYPNLEYIVVDGGSTDGTQEIIKKYERQISWWVSQPDNGLYDALNTGFAQSSGAVMGWLNASDLLHTGGLFVVGSVFRALPNVQWITGRPTAFGEDGSTIDVGDLPRWSRGRYLAGANRYIQQESTYWRRGLWNTAGACVDASRRDASDCELWVRFFRHAKLYSVDSLIGGYRMHADAISATEQEKYHQAMKEILSREDPGPNDGWVRLFHRCNNMMSKIPKARGYWKKIASSALYRWHSRDWPPVIRSSDGAWYFDD